MMRRLCSVPPQTFGTFSPARSATSINCTGEDGVDATAVFTCVVADAHRGVARRSRSELPRTKAVDPRKRRRGMIMRFRDYRKPGNGKGIRIILLSVLGMDEERCRPLLSPRRWYPRER